MPALHQAALLRLMPRGLVDLSADTLDHEELAVFAAPLDGVEINARKLVAEIHPQSTSALLERWEELYQLRSRGWTFEQRRQRLLARVRVVPDNRPVTIQELVVQLTGITWVLTEPRAFRFSMASSLLDVPNDVLDGVFVFLLDASRAAAVAAGVRRNDLVAFVGRIQPAHTVCVERFDDFRFSDPFSLLDRDFLAA